MKLPGDMSKEELLEAATDRIFSLGPRDLASALAYENMRYGLGKMIYALDNLDLHCVFGPDATITRNVKRWISGFGYGALIKWPKQGMFFPELRPNGCGMLLARIDGMLQQKEIIDRISELENSELYLDNVKIEPDFGHGNHFFEFYSVLESSPDIEKILPEKSNYAVIHGSCPERKDEVYSAVDKGEWVKTPLGKISVLDGNEGQDYYKLWKEFDDFCKRRRELLAREVLGDCEVISNLTHQGLFAENEIRLGCYDTMVRSQNNKEIMFPVALRWDTPVYIFKGKKNLSEEVIGRLGFDERADELGLINELKRTNILPHGGGYRLELEYTKMEVVTTEIGNHFILSGAKPVSKVGEMIETTKKGVSRFGEMIIMSPNELPYDYRGVGVIEKTMEYNLAALVAKLQPLMTLKV